MIFYMVTHETLNNTLEVTVLEQLPDSVNRVSCRNFSPAEKAEFVTLLGAIADKYILMAGW